MDIVDIVDIRLYLYLAGGHHGVAHGAQQQPGQQPDVGHTLQELLGALQVVICKYLKA